MNDAQSSLDEEGKLSDEVGEDPDGKSNVLSDHWNSTRVDNGIEIMYSNKLIIIDATSAFL
ncbi:hypothetical protein [Candidatus Villigracilis saccharophilus]|uniref:hypothetical protein n=1 Tax=Candidatus Villigracilis saccharophilus TaxID=3140684 RepID=UPI0031362752|nr:hypothetical protein [Anaerolineales bacterium]